MPRVALEPAVCEGSLLKHPDPPDPFVRLAEDAQPEQADRDDEDRGPEERDEQLRADPGRQAARPNGRGCGRVGSPPLVRASGPLAPALARGPTRLRGRAARTLPRDS